MIQGISMQVWCGGRFRSGEEEAIVSEMSHLFRESRVRVSFASQKRLRPRFHYN